MSTSTDAATDGKPTLSTVARTFVSPTGEIFSTSNAGLIAYYLNAGYTPEQPEQPVKRTRAKKKPEQPEVEASVAPKQPEV